MVQIYYGDAKGKTTAAIGQTIRALGQGKSVMFTQFLKDFCSGEIEILRQLKNVTVFDEFKVEKFIFNMSDEEKSQTKEQMQTLFEKVCEKSKLEKADFIVLDEVLDAIALELISEKDLLKFLRENKDRLEIILTGRKPSEELCEVADYLSELKMKKHPYQKGVVARVGVEF